MSNKHEHARLLKKVMDLFMADHAHYPADSKGVTPIPSRNLIEWADALMEGAAIALLKAMRPRMNPDEVPNAVLQMRLAAIQSVRESLEELT